jgi:Kef-type K+ transport system membrane component KefB
MARLLVLVVIVGVMLLLIRGIPPQLASAQAASTLCFGFMILTAYILAHLLSRLKLPKITGYILAGMVFGPSLLGLVPGSVVQELRLVDDLALTFIAFAAGGELRLGMLRKAKRSIFSTLVGIIVATYTGVTLVLFALGDLFPFSAGLPRGQMLAVAAISGALSVARSPSSVIAIISETKAKGRFTEMILGVTVALDVLAIFIFAITVSVAETALSPGKSLDLSFVAGIAGEVAASVILGLLLGKIIATYLERVRAQLTFFTLGAAFLVTKLSAALALLLEAHLGVQFHVEPMLICITAGLVVQNFSRHGESFLRVIDRSSLPIYVIFFSLAGAALRLEVLEHTWHWALILSGIRAVFIYLGCYVGGTVGGDPPRARRVSGVSFLTQAGVSLGLVKIVIHAFPQFGVDYATLLVAVITINQIVGPVGFKLALGYVGESREARLARKRPAG